MWVWFLSWESESGSHSVVSDSLRPHRLYSPWNSPDQNTGVGSLSLLQGIFPTQGDGTQVSLIASGFSTSWAIREDSHWAVESNSSSLESDLALDICSAKRMQQQWPSQTLSVVRKRPCSLHPGHPLGMLALGHLPCEKSDCPGTAMLSATQTSWRPWRMRKYVEVLITGKKKLSRKEIFQL